MIAPLTALPPPPKPASALLTRDQRARLLFGDREETRQERNAFEKARRTEISYTRKLRQLADRIGALVDSYDANDTLMPLWIPETNTGSLCDSS